jgi:DNA-directed RNA polymerase subunit M/transcription elongation factor TFIIS
MRFCTKNNCDNFLTSVIKNNHILYRCTVCFEEYPLEPVDTLMIDEYLQENDTIHKHKTYLKNAHADDIAELIHKDCVNKQCKETIVKVIKVSQNGQSLYVCPTCKIQFS